MDNLKQRQVKRWQLPSKYEVTGYWDYGTHFDRVYKLQTRLGNFMFSRIYYDPPTSKDRQALFDEALIKKGER